MTPQQLKPTRAVQELKKGKRFRSESAHREKLRGRTAKIHAAVDGLGNPLHIKLTAGQRQYASH